MAITVREVLAFHKLDRTLFERLVAFGQNPEIARNVVALWMWLELIGINVISYIKDCRNKPVFLRFASEAEAILESLRQGSTDPDGRDIKNVIPLTASLVAESLDLRFFYFNCDVAVRGVTYMLDGVGKLIADDYLYSSLRTYEAAVRAAEEEGRRRGVRVPLPALPAELARPYIRQAVPSPEDCRSMFVTFSKGYPLGREDIVEYFTLKWGPCIERVMIEKTEAGVMPMYGRIVFTSVSYVELVLHGEHHIKFVIKGRQLWARKYVPKKN